MQDTNFVRGQKALAASIDMAGEGFLRHNVTFVNCDRNRAVQQMECENRGNTSCSRHVLRVGSNSAKFGRSRRRRRKHGRRVRSHRKRGRRKSRKVGTLLKRVNPAAEQRVMSLQNLLKSRFPQKSKSLLRTPAPTKEELLIKVTQAFLLFTDCFDSCV